MRWRANTPLTLQVSQSPNIILVIVEVIVIMIIIIRNAQVI